MNILDRVRRVCAPTVQKPRIVRWPMSTKWGWKCSCSRYRGYGLTPETAYSAWEVMRGK